MIKMHKTDEGEAFCKPLEQAWVARRSLVQKAFRVLAASNADPKAMKSCRLSCADGGSAGADEGDGCCRLLRRRSPGADPSMTCGR